MSKFKVGDKVRVKKSFVIKGCTLPSMRKYAGITGTITEEEFGDYMIDSTGNLWWNVDSIEFVTEAEQPRREFIVIRRSGAETIAELRHDREVIKSAVATCSEKDTFDFDTGAKLAFDRLMGRQNIDEAIKAWNEPTPAPEPPKFYTGKVFAPNGAEVADMGQWITTANTSVIIGGDNAHPTDAGHKVMAARFYEAYRALLAAN